MVGRKYCTKYCRSAVASPIVDLVAVHEMACHGRPPLPVELEMSMVKLLHAPSYKEMMFERETLVGGIRVRVLFDYVYVLVYFDRV